MPAGAALLLKLRTPIDSAKVSVDDQVEATLWSPVIHDGVELIPEGSVAIGKVVEVKRATEREPLGAVAFVFTVIEHAGTGSRAAIATREVLVQAPRPQQPGRGLRKRRPKPVQATMSAGASLVAITAEPLVVRIPR